MHELLACEAEARAKGAGVWGISAYRVVAANNLNFDKDWHRDFTVLVDLKHNDALKAAGVDAKALAGKRLRVRVWIEWRNGPMIHVTHVEQIEILPDAGAATPQTPETRPPGAIVA